jgi:NADH dehydrogenase
VVDIDDTVYFEMEKPFKQKNLIWAAEFLQSFRRIRLRVMVAKEWLPFSFNKVNGTENIYAIGDTCIQLTDTISKWLANTR